jgi:hypothetical protein
MGDEAIEKTARLIFERLAEFFGVSTRFDFAEVDRIGRDMRAGIVKKSDDLNKMHSP